MQIAADVNSGKIKLPDLDLEDDASYEAVWALVDSGSSVHAVDVEKVMPGAKIRKPRRDAPGFRTACNGTVPDRGSTDVPFWSGEGNRHDIHWRNSPVAMPILSTKLLALDNGELRYQAESGQVIHVHTGDQSAFVAASGVYFMKMYIRKEFTQSDPSQAASQDFPRQGS